MRVDSVKKGLRAEIDASGYFPDLVEDAITLAVGDEELLDFVVHHEPTFNHDEIHRHVTILALTPTRLIIGHTDDHPPEPHMPGSYAATSTESVALRRITNVVLTRVVTQPEVFTPGASGELYEIWLTVGWGAVRRVDLEQASCNDPECDADHGYTGALVADDLTVRMGTGAVGTERVARLAQFASRLQRAAAV
jgi:hypothetical protein